MGEKVFSVNILNMNNDTVALPMLGQKNLLIFYADLHILDRTKPSAIISRLIRCQGWKLHLMVLSI